jgi:hypothetical protein
VLYLLGPASREGVPKSPSQLAGALLFQNVCTLAIAPGVLVVASAGCRRAWNLLHVYLRITDSVMNNSLTFRYLFDQRHFLDT